MAKQTLNNLESAGTSREKLNSNFTEIFDTLDDKVAKETGKTLTTNDLTDALKTNYDAAYSHSQSSHIEVAASDATAVAEIVGHFRFRAEANAYYVEVCVQTGAATYAWEAIVTKTW